MGTVLNITLQKQIRWPYVHIANFSFFQSAALLLFAFAFGFAFGDPASDACPFLFLASIALRIDSTSTRSDSVNVEARRHNLCFFFLAFFSFRVSSLRSAIIWLFFPPQVLDSVGEFICNGLF